MTFPLKTTIVQKDITTGKLVGMTCRVQLFDTLGAPITVLKTIEVTDAATLASVETLINKTALGGL